MLLVIICLGMITVSVAQPRQRMSAEEREKQMIEALSLNESQQTKLKEINAKYQERFQEMRQGMREQDEETRRANFSKMREVMDARNKEIRAILDEGQVKKFDEMEKQREERMKNRREPGQRGGDVRPGK